MGLFVHEDSDYDPAVRQVGFNRYKQLLSQHASSWIKLNLLTILGALPLAAGIGYAILSSSILLLTLIYVLLAPWTLLLLLFLGLWYITFLSQFLIYEQMDRELGIEEKFQKRAYSLEDWG